MPSTFDFSLSETWGQNLDRLKTHLESIDSECAAVFFAHLTALQSDDSNARRDFNQQVFEAIEAASEAEITVGGHN
jgi:septation ring formation regulator EzrA